MTKIIHANLRNKKGDSRFVSREHLDKIGETAVYYGFMPIKSPVISKTDLEIARGFVEADYVDDQTELHSHLPLHVEEKIALIRAYSERNMDSLPQPVMLYLKDPGRGSTKKTEDRRYADLEIIGVSGSIAEALLIQTSRAILAEEGYRHIAVEINSLGDKDSMARFARELSAYYRKNINTMSPECRQLFKRDPFKLLSSSEESCLELNKLAPRSMDFLPEASRRHLEEVLEYLETLKIPYIINNSLIGNRSYCSETIFTIVNTDPANKKSKDSRILALGVSWNNLGKHVGIKRDISGVGLSILIKGRVTGLRKPIGKVKRPIAAFVQLGMESKLLSLKVIESLRQVKIPLHFSLAKDRLGAQVSSMDKLHTPYVIVIGKKEAVERTAIVRRTDTYSQDIVPLADLPNYMKKAEKKYFGK
ncbi:MAG: hypothetical protein A3B11_01345 [Candidatus Taylorbacteria bacterium RIFCSPLOWO2_01_FULL_44_26]|uniref:Histidyl-tRNA synthetase n=2 Tax=Candidatus Tayloriibacteriota TaxID=1817919 RepID=A0A1G2MK69_9BACT|nr:MAG: hypothetical protein A3D50_01125 [Candidatus Taylorbacteria bacterium RIFCSPHIGHO2_02_FULL_44_12]OHA30959.1 MAG: hypothetical protein A3B11_01345 [Candidatus Taylorbacteria bacterium RIFCSPLOWO2_01_FULL_44_26]